LRPRFLALAGPLRGSVYLLADGQEVSLCPEAGITSAAESASSAGASCLIRGVAGEYTLTASANTTLAHVNGAPAASRQLRHGDVVRVGGAEWLFLTEKMPAGSHLAWSETLCQDCGACQAVCPTGSLRLRRPAETRHELLGNSAPMQRVNEFISRVAPTDSTVLILGESGTGKELAARAIHRNSRRADQPFVAINCAALPPSLAETELFGHEKGAFTGALAQKKGKLEVAAGGTVFLDEIGELDLGSQSKLLRVLQERELERVGATRPIPVDFRLIAATNQNLEQALAAGRFRQDLYYRLNVVSVRMPALRERREDIPLLAACFMARYSVKCGRRSLALSNQARECLVTHDWPGNVRELENAIERAVVLGSSELVLPEDLPESILERAPPDQALCSRYHGAVAEAKRQVILQALEQAGGSYKDAAGLLGIHPNNLHRLISKLGLRPALKKATP